MMGTKKKAYVWTFVAGTMVGYRFSLDRSGKTPMAVLGDSTGSLVVDAYTGYNEVTRPARRVRGGCLARARRKVFEARKTAPEGDAALAIITEIYKVEHEAKAAGILGTAAHLAMRQERSRPLMDGLHTWLEEQKPHHVPKGPMGKAIRYALGNWQALTRFLDDPNIDPDNNKAEGALHRVAVAPSLCTLSSSARNHESSIVARNARRAPSTLAEHGARQSGRRVASPRSGIDAGSRRVVA